MSSRRFTGETATRTAETSPEREPKPVVDKELSEKSTSKTGLPRPVTDSKAHRINVSARAVDDVFVETEDGPDLRGVSKWGAMVLVLKSQIGLGILSIPSVFNTIGLVPGLIAVIFLGGITTYGDYILGQFVLAYPGVHSVGDVGFIMGGRWGREFIGWGYFLYQVFNVASGLLAGSIAFNAMTSHATCTVAFTAVSAVIVGLFAGMRTFKAISWIVWVGATAVISSVLLVTISAGVSDRPPAGPPAPLPFDKKLRAFGDPTFAEGMVAVVNVLFAYGGSPGFFSIIAEMRNPKEFSHAMLGAQFFTMALYVSIATAIWYECGQYVASPALGSAGPLIKKIAYGIGLPGVLAGPVIQSHLAIKYLFVRLLRGTVHLQHSTKIHWLTWISNVVFVLGFGFIIANVIPFFSELIGLVGALFASFFCIALLGAMWIFDFHEVKKETPGIKTSFGRKVLYAIAAFMVLVGAFILVAGMYGTVLGINTAFAEGTVGSPFSCADNSGLN